MLIRIIAAAVWLVIVTGCTRHLTGDAIEQRRYPYANQPSTTLIVFLPGLHDSAVSFDRNGFTDSLQSHRIPADVIAAEADFNYYRQQTIVQRLHDDIIVPAREQGYTRIWLVGISLGGYGSLLYQREYPMHITGLVLLGPYLGPPELIEAIREQRDPAHWPTTGMPPPNDSAQLWQWLLGNAGKTGGLQRVYLGYGTSDRFASAHRLLSKQVPDQHVFTVPGRHDWNTWRQLWNRMLDQQILIQ